MKELNVLICGAGAVGIFFGVKFLKAGFNVCFTDIPERNELLKNSCPRVESAIDKDFALKGYDFKPQVVEDIRKAPPQDIILVCVKAFQTYDVAMKLLPVVKPSTITLSPQNGLDNEKVLSDFLGKSLVMGSVLYFNGVLENQTTVLQKAPAQIIFGEMDLQPSQREERLSSIFSHADIEHKISRNIIGEIWIKFIWHNVFSSISAVSNATIRQILNCQGILSTIKQMMLEVRQIAQAEGIEISAKLIDELSLTDNNYPEVKIDMLKNIDKIPELELFLRVTLEKAQKIEISTPVSQTIYSLIQLLVSVHKKS